jgi:hypothetical protein
MSNFEVDQIVRAVRDTSTVGGRAIKEGEQFVVLSKPDDDDAYMGVTPLSGHWPARNGFPSEASGNERIVSAGDFEAVPPKHEPASSELYIDSGLADHARFQLDGDGIALDLFTPGTRAHISGRRLDSAQIQDLLQWLADHGHTLDETDTPKPEPVTGRGTAYVFGMVPQGVDQRRYHGFLRDSGSFVFFDDKGAFSYALPDQYDGFEPEPKPE